MNTTDTTNTLGMELPKRIGHYRLEREIAGGAAGVVFLAHDERLDCKVAIKFLRPELARRKRNVKRFRHEARVAASIKHQNVVGVRRYGEYQKVPFIVMEYVDGSTLNDVVREQGPLDPLTGAECLLQAAVGLAAAAEAGHVHRDIKPSNMMLDASGKVKITDFGLARSIDYESGLTNPNQIVGTPNYIAPEQALRDEVDFRADMYALGASFYFLFTGHVPFEDAQTVTDKLHAHAYGIPRPVAELRPALPARLCRIVERLMAKKPVERYRSYEALIANLEYLVRTMAADSRQAAARPSDPALPKAVVRSGRHGAETAKVRYARRMAAVVTTESHGGDGEAAGGWQRWLSKLVAAGCALFTTGLTLSH